MTALQEIMNGLATCTGQQAQESQGITEDYLKIGVLTTASECGLTSPLSPGPLDTCPGAFSKINELETTCGSTDDDAQVPRTDTTCASGACASFIANVTDAALQKMMTGLANCTGELAQSTAFFTEDYLKIAVLATASECGLTSPLSPFPLDTCLGAISKFNEMSSSCGSTDDDAQVPRTDTTCASDACAGVIASVTDAALQEMIIGLATCTGELAQYATTLTEDYLKISVLTTASECGLTSPLSPFPLDTCLGAMRKYNEMSSSCGETGDNASVPRTAETCASDACAGAVSSMTHGVVQRMSTGASKCTPRNPFQAFQAASFLTSVVLATANDCGLTSPPLIADVCSTANEGWSCGSIYDIYSGKTCQCTGRRRARHLLFSTLPGASCRCA